MHYSAGTSSQHGMQMAMGVGDPSHTYLRGQWGSAVRDWQKIWTTGNDGSGSGLDADTVDGIHGTSLARTDVASTFTATATFATNPIVDGLKLGSDASMGMYTNHGDNCGVKFYHSSANYYCGMIEGGTDGGAPQNGGGQNPYIRLYAGYNQRIRADEDEVQIYRREMTSSDGNQYSYGALLITDSQATGMAGVCIDSTGSGLGYSAQYGRLWSWRGTFTGTLQYGSLSAYSDARIKSDIQPITSALDAITQIQGVTFIKDGNSTAGVIAQQVETVLPDLVHTNDPDGDCYRCPKDAEGNEIHDYKTVEYTPLIAYLIEAVKELTEQNTEMKQRLDKLEE